MQVRRRDTGEILAMKVLKKENIFARNDPKDLQARTRTAVLHSGAAQRCCTAVLHSGAAQRCCTAVQHTAQTRTHVAAALRGP